MLTNSPVNEETQKNIENLLMNYSYVDLSDKSLSDHNMRLDYSIVNRDLAKILLEEKESLFKLINNFRTHLQEDMSPLNEDITNIFTTTRVDFFVRIMYGRLLKIIYYHQRFENSNSVVDIGYDLGKDIINNYYEKCYSKYKKEYEKENRLYYLST
jgi:hypothetical protein